MTLQCTMKAEHGSVFELIQNIHPYLPYSNGVCFESTLEKIQHIKGPLCSNNLKRPKEQIEQN